MMQTRCPACGTRFFITSEQLKARQGQVRCGQCQTIFDALATLSDTPPAQNQTPDANAPSSAHPAATLSVAPVNIGTTAKDSETETSFPAESDTHHDAAPAMGAIPASNSEPAAETNAELNTSENHPDNALATAEKTLDAHTLPAAAADAGTNSHAQATAPAEADIDTHITPASLPGSSWHQGMISSSQAQSEKPSSRIWLSLSLLAATVLMLQLGVQFRTQLALALPAIKPQLQTVLGLFDIELSLPHKADQLSIENSDMQPLVGHPGQLELTATLKNRAPFAQQPPHLELTLTNDFDQPVLRKILSPNVYLPDQPRQQQSFDPGEEISVHLILQPAKDLKSPASGYRLYLFYP